MIDVTVQIPSFRNPKLLRQALTHRSAINEHQAQEHNERLEFLGDAVIELVVSEYLFNVFPHSPEGELTAARTALVRTETLAAVASKLGIQDRIYLSKGEQRVGGNLNPALLADTFEAVVGALYLDRGPAVTTSFVKETLLLDAESTIKSAQELDTKSKLQELVQAKGHPSPVYRILDKQGPDHNRTFTAQVFVSGKPLATGKGKSKQEAEQSAARASLRLI